MYIALCTEKTEPSKKKTKQVSCREYLGQVSVTLCQSPKESFFQEITPTFTKLESLMLIK